MRIIDLLALPLVACGSDRHPCADGGCLCEAESSCGIDCDDDGCDIACVDVSDCDVTCGAHMDPVPTCLTQSALPLARRERFASIGPALQPIAGRAGSVTSMTPARAGGSRSAVRVTQSSVRAWTIVAPADAALPLRLPALPDALAAYRPTGADATFVEAVYLEGSFLGWNQLRQAGGDFTLHQLTAPFTLRATAPEFDHSLGAPAALRPGHRVGSRVDELLGRWRSASPR